MISFLMVPDTSLATASGLEISADSRLVLSKVTTCLQYGHFAMVYPFEASILEIPKTWA
jgi:hypothetical protein